MRQDMRCGLDSTLALWYNGAVKQGGARPSLAESGGPWRRKARHGRDYQFKKQPPQEPQALVYPPLLWWLPEDRSELGAFVQGMAW